MRVQDADRIRRRRRPLSLLITEFSFSSIVARSMQPSATLAVVFHDSDVQVVQHRQMPLDLLPEPLGDLHAIVDRERSVHRDIGFAMQAMPQPARARIEYAANSRNLLARLAHRCHKLRFDPIEQTDEDRGCGLPNDPQDHHGDCKTNDWIGPRKAQFHRNRSRGDRKTRQAIDPRMITVSDQSRAMNLATRPDPDEGCDLIRNEANHTGDRDRTQSRDRLRLDQPPRRFVSRSQRACENDCDNRDSGKVLDPA